MKALESAVEDTLAKVFGPDTVEYNRYHIAACLDNAGLILGHHYHSQEIQQFIGDGIAQSVSLLREAIWALEEDLAERAATHETMVRPGLASDRAPESNRIFVVHGHDEAVREAVARFLAKAGFDPIILHEQASGGRTIIEELEHYSDVGFAVILLTPDDVGGASPDKLQPRARQNVVAELFYFIGKLGRARVCALLKESVEIPSDIGVVVYVKLDERGAWKADLLRELAAAHYSVDWAKALA